MTYLSEFRVYGLSDMAGDAGGMVGMLLGMSILTIYDSLYVWIVKWRKKICKVLEETSCTT